MTFVYCSCCDNTNKCSHSRDRGLSGTTTSPLKASSILPLVSSSIVGSLHVGCSTIKSTFSLNVVDYPRNKMPSLYCLTRTQLNENVQCLFKYWIYFLDDIITLHFQHFTTNNFNISNVKTHFFHISLGLPKVSFKVFIDQIELEALGFFPEKVHFSSSV